MRPGVRGGIAHTLRDDQRGGRRGHPATGCDEDGRPLRPPETVPADDAPAFPLTAPPLTARGQRAPNPNTIITPATISIVATPNRPVPRSGARRDNAASTP